MYYFWKFLGWFFGIMGALSVYSGLGRGGPPYLIGGLVVSGFSWLCFRAARGIWRHQVILEDAALVTLRGREAGDEDKTESIVDRLRRLDELKASELVSAEEYDRQRARIIGDV